jgi:hypothetical protein
MTTAKAARKPKAAREPEPGQTPYADPGWTCTPADMTAPWDGVSPSWIEREAAHLQRRIQDYRYHPQAPPGHARELLRDAYLMLGALLGLLGDDRAPRAGVAGESEGNPE